MVKIIDKIVKKHLHPMEDYIHGYADLTGLLSDKFGEFNFGISIGRRLDSRIMDKIINGPTMEYYSHYREVNEILSLLTHTISEELNLSDIESLNIEPTVSTSDLDTIYFDNLRTDLSHKMVATRAGLGWIGKTDLFISNEFGPRLRLVSILLKAPVKPETDPINTSRCGKCNICVEICPAKAANGSLWDITIDRDKYFDAFKCRNQCAEYGKTNLSANARVCGICVAACPAGQKKFRHRKPDAA